jgi:hypothetical protein
VSLCTDYKSYIHLLLPLHYFNYTTIFELNQTGYLKLTTGSEKGLHSTVPLFSELHNVPGVLILREKATARVILKLLAL